MPYSAHAIVESIIKKLGSSDLVTLVKRGLRYGEKSGENSGKKGNPGRNLSRNLVRNLVRNLKGVQ